MPSEIDELASYYFGAPVEKELETHAVVVDGTSVYHVGVEGERFYKHDITHVTSWSIGSGYHHAYTAMDLGLSAKDAVKMAALRDTMTGGRIRTLVPPKKTKKEKKK